MAYETDSAPETYGKDQIEFGPVRRAQLGLGFCGFGAVLATFPFGTALAYVGLVFIAGGALLSSSFQRKRHGWWALLILASALAVVSPVVALASESAGGLIAILGGILILAVVVYAFPTGDEAP